MKLKPTYSKTKIKVGDLVSHHMYPREWWAIVLEVKIEEKGLGEGEHKAFVNIVPGTEHVNYFRNPSGRGWVYRKWLWLPTNNRDDFEQLESLIYPKK